MTFLLSWLIIVAAILVVFAIYGIIEGCFDGYRSRNDWRDERDRRRAELRRLTWAEIEESGYSYLTPTPEEETWAT